MRKLLLTPLIVLATVISMPHIAQPMQGNVPEQQGLYEYSRKRVKCLIKLGVCFTLVIFGFNYYTVSHCFSDCNNIKCFVQCHEENAISVPFLKPDNEAMQKDFAQYFTR